MSDNLKIWNALSLKKYKINYYDLGHEKKEIIRNIWFRNKYRKLSIFEKILAKIIEIIILFFLAIILGIILTLLSNLMQMH